MDSAILFDAPQAVMSCMLLTTIITATAHQPAAVPVFFQRMWRSYQVFQERRRIKASERPGEKFWEIDMTKFEP